MNLIASGAVLMILVGWAGLSLMEHGDEPDISIETTTSTSETTTTETDTSTTTATSTTDTTTTTSTTTAETTVTTKPSTTTEAVTEPVIFETQPVVTAAPVVETTAEPETTTTVATTEIDIPEESTVVETVTETVATEAVNEEFVGTFTRGTYYTFGSRGGSGRKLVSGYSIASRALYEMYGYVDYKVRIECDEFPALNGIYSLDDCSAKGDNRVIDFWFAPGEVPGYFYQQGVLEVRAYIIR